MTSVGARVSVNLEGMTVGGVPCVGDSWTPGTVQAVSGSLITVRLDSPFSSGAGTAQDTVTVRPERIEGPAMNDEQAVAIGKLIDKTRDQLREMVVIKREHPFDSARLQTLIAEWHESDAELRRLLQL